MLGPDRSRLRRPACLVDGARQDPMTAAPPRSQPIRRVDCRGHRFRYPSVGRNFHPDSVQTTSLSETYCTGFHLSNEILGRAFSRFVSGCHNSSMSHGSEHLPSGWFSYAERSAAARGSKAYVFMAYDILSRALALGHRRGLPIAEFSSPFESRLPDNLLKTLAAFTAQQTLFATLGYAWAGHRRMSAPK
jgi:hypothetical protein